MIRVIGLIKCTDQHAFEIYRSQVGATIEKFQGKVLGRGKKLHTFWNELACEDFNQYVEVEFPSLEVATMWANSEEYQQLLTVRAQAMQLLLFAIDS